MTTTPATGAQQFESRTNAVLAELESTGQLKHLQMIEGPMGPRITLRDRGEVECFCSNNYLGLANHPDVVAAGHEGLDRYGAGTASVRFICGTFEPHEHLEQTLTCLGSRLRTHSYRAGQPARLCSQHCVNLETRLSRMH